ncbi:outer membrane protein [Bradyrhizobium sp. URHD0069]|uniref:outer membrane protein n=1 Tax=Bradyrhizobium sp. URHD0069 TaxID=1380355 RepID=UPI00049787D2|nr:outer membrane beta-barrel protein [Bradyrhizobium sp. URHD0069]
MKNLALALAALGLGTVAASAADMPGRYAKAPVAVAPVATWTGCYIGVNAGYSWGDGSSSLALQPSVAAFGALDPAAFAALGGRYTGSPSGALGGGQVGCNYQSGIVVVGIEADIDYLGASETASRAGGVAVPFAGTIPLAGTVSQKLDWLGSVRGRVGISPGSNWLLYATGGLAYGNTSFSHQFVQGAVVPSGWAGALNNDFRTGWIAGAGVEYMVAPNWTVKGEYLYYDLGSTRVVGLPFNRLADQFGADGLYTTKGSIARVGFNYKFGWGGPVVARY